MKTIWNKYQFFSLIFLLFASAVHAQILKSEKAFLPIYTSPPEKIVEEVDNEPPDLKIMSPLFTEENIFSTINPEINIIGKATDNNKIGSIIINSEVIDISEAGVFSTRQTLYPGDNEILIVAVDQHDNFIENKYIIKYTPVKISFEDMVKKESKYFALIIGINNYQDPLLTDLDNPIKDAERIYNILTTYYTFEKENVQFLKNATREDIINVLDRLANEVSENDNLLIFYAGHGLWDEKANIGYWLPADAKQNSKAAWFSNSRLVDYLKEVKSQHTLLIADACFTGSIFKTRSAFTDAPKAMQKLYALPSRKAMTSGTLTEVPDRSSFMTFLCDRLANNTERCLSSEQLFSSIRIAVINNSDAIPQYGEIRNVGDQGGDFIFIRK